MLHYNCTQAPRSVHILLFFAFLRVNLAPRGYNKPGPIATVVGPAL